MTPQDWARLDGLSRSTGQWLEQHAAVLCTAESCTGGWIAQTVTATAGSSVWFDRAFVTYSNQAKQDMLGVRADTLLTHGAVSEATVREMAEGALARSQASHALAVSGIAGPGGATPGKPVGTVCLAWAVRHGPTLAETCHFSGDRETVRLQAVLRALERLPQLPRLPGSETDHTHGR